MLLDHRELLLLERIADLFADDRNFNGILLAARLRRFSQQSRILFQADLTRSLLLFGFLLHVWQHLFVEGACGGVVGVRI